MTKPAPRGEHNSITSTPGRRTCHQRRDFGLGPDTVAALLIAIGDNPDRLRSEAAFAHLCGVALIPASSAKHIAIAYTAAGSGPATARYIAAVVRLTHDPRSRAYADRRTTEGMSMPEILRCQKRYLAREVFKALRADYAELSAGHL